MAVRFIDTMPWAGPWPWSRRCKAKKRKTGDEYYYGRCELMPHWGTVPHCLERGMIWIRWNDGEVWATGPEYKRVED